MEALLGLVAEKFKLAIAAMILLLGAFRWLLGRRDLQFSRRMDFVQSWRNPNEADALTVELLARQMFGAYLPAAVVRRICDRPGVEVSRTLFELGEVWRLVDWDGSSHKIAWKSEASTSKRRGSTVVVLWIAYFVSAFVGMTILYFVATGSVATAVSIASTVWAVVFLGLAAVALSKMGAWGAAYRLGDDFIGDINRKIAESTVAAQSSLNSDEVVDTDGPASSHSV